MNALISFLQAFCMQLVYLQFPSVALAAEDCWSALPVFAQSLHNETKELPVDCVENADGI